MQNEAIEPDNKVNNPVARDAFKPGSWLAKIDLINHLVLFNNVMITVLAEQGSGKTTFIELLKTGLDQTVKPYAIKVTAPFCEKHFLEELEASFHLRHESNASFASLVEQVNERKAKVLVIIDDAQHLPDNFLQDILQQIKQQADRGFFHLCLVSDFSLAINLNKLESESFAGLIHRLELGVLTEVEMKTYLLNNLPSPTRLDLTMTDKRLEQFYQLTGGNIARINSQMADYFCSKPVRPLVKRSSLPKRISLVAGVVLAVFASSYIWKTQALPLAVQSPEEAVKEEILAMPSPMILPSVVPPVPVELEFKPILVSELPDINKALIERPSEIPTWYVAAINEQVQPPPLKRVTNIVLDEVDENDDSLVVRDRVVVIPRTLNLTKVKQSPVQPEIKQVVTVNKLVKANLLAKSNKQGQFTIQLLASRNLNDIKRLANNHPLKEGFRIRLTKRDGLDWYVLTIGEYGQIDKAQTVIKNLPAEFAQYKPWIRNVAQLKAVG